MDSNAPLEQSAPSAPHFSPEGQDQIANKKSHNKMIIILLSIFAIIATAAAVVFGVMYFTNQKPTDQPTPETSVQEEETERAAEETEITDETLKKDLDEKIATIFYTDQMTPSFFLDGVADAQELLTKGDLSISQKIAATIERMPKYKLSYDEAVAAGAQSGYGADEFVANGYGVKSTDVIKRYKEIFGDGFTAGEEGKFFCSDYRYNQQYDFYFNQVLGCGGTGSIREIYYKNRYTVNPEHAYVYISAGLLNLEDNKAYCDPIKNENNRIPEGTEVCGELSANHDFEFNESNYKNFAQYRAIFDKDGDGNYFFEKIEKL